MFSRSTPIYQQPFVVLDSRTSQEIPVPPDQMVDDDVHPNFGLSLFTVPVDLDLNEREITKLIPATTFKSVPVLWNAELANDYRELGDALVEMKELRDDEDWSIEAPVYVSACYVASQMMSYPLPVPRIFSHGPKSVVFNWAYGTDNIYLTVSSDRVSALVSSPEQIKMRKDIDLTRLIDPSSTFLSLRAALSDTPIARLESGSLVDSVEELVS